MTRLWLIFPASQKPGKLKAPVTRYDPRLPDLVMGHIVPMLRSMCREIQEGFSDAFIEAPMV